MRYEVPDVELTEEQEEQAARIEDILVAKARTEARFIARLAATAVPFTHGCSADSKRSGGKIVSRTDSHPAHRKSDDFARAVFSRGT